MNSFEGDGDADVIAFEKAMLKQEKMNRVKEWSEKGRTNIRYNIFKGILYFNFNGLILEAVCFEVHKFSRTTFYVHVSIER